MKIHFFKIAAVMVVLAGWLTSCGEKKLSDENTDVFEENCIVKYMPHPDNCNDYMIVVENENPVYNTEYKPEQLPDEFKVDNLRVKVKFSISDKKHNCGFGGYASVVNIIKIEKQ
ncbi:MAG: hypothetical protein LBV41_09475 [Cytophagaceae bacterium]|jgi:hypothetical protein|nr:hypothetical protein [Cytophagaceae bacterium]